MVFAYISLIHYFNNIFHLGGPYAAFGGRDASRGLATFSVSTKTDGYDDLSDLNTMEMESVKEWEAQFKGKPDTYVNNYIKHLIPTC